MMAQHRERCRQLLLFGGLTLALLFVAVSCRQSSGRDSPGTSAPPPAPTYVNTVYPRNHVPPNIYWGFVHVTFTAQTTYDQAHTLLSQVGVYAYPMVNPPCGDLREAGAPIPVPTAMSPEELQADFQHSHTMLVQTDAWEKLNRVAASPGVVAVNPFPLPKSCPAHAPI
jgi:hypothetical protein